MPLHLAIKRCWSSGAMRIARTRECTVARETVRRRKKAVKRVQFVKETRWNFPAEVVIIEAL